MFTQLFVVALSIASGFTFTEPLQIVQIDGSEFYLLPVPEENHYRFRRESETTGTVGDHGQVRVENKAVIVDNVNHRLDLTNTAERQFSPKGPLTTTNKLDYTYKPNDSGFTAQTTNTRGQGTDAAFSGNYNFFRTPDKQGYAALSAQASQHFGTPGRSRPDYGIFLHGGYNF